MPKNDPNCAIANILASFGFKDREGAIIRAIWGLFISIAICLPRVIFKQHYFLPYWYIPLNVAVNFGASRLKLNFWITDILVSASVSTILI